jgi:hypothetical protein
MHKANDGVSEETEPHVEVNTNGLTLITRMIPSVWCQSSLPPRVVAPVAIQRRNIDLNEIAYYVKRAADEGHSAAQFNYAV